MPAHQFFSARPVSAGTLVVHATASLIHDAANDIRVWEGEVTDPTSPAAGVRGHGRTYGAMREALQEQVLAVLADPAGNGLSCYAGDAWGPVDLQAIRHVHLDVSVAGCDEAFRAAS